MEQPQRKLLSSNSKITDNIFNLIELAKEKDRFETKSDTIEFIVGLKLFSEVMLRHRKHPLFEEFLPEFSKFMKKLKAK